MVTPGGQPSTMQPTPVNIKREGVSIKDL